MIRKVFLTTIALFSIAITGCNLIPESQSGTNTITSGDKQDDERIKRIYDLYIDSGGTLSYEEWLATIKGEKGDTGDTGPAGEPGKDGSAILSGTGTPSSKTGNLGDYYINTLNWDFYKKSSLGWSKIGNLKGEKGEQGNQGNAGPQGPQGEQGPRGNPGADGSSVLTGNGVPLSNLGNDGDSYIDLLTWNYYVKSNDSWVLKGNIKGADGQNGSQGAQGPQGNQGEQGPQGDQGPAGQNGNDGVSIINTYIDSNGDLIIEYSNGISTNAGHLKDVDECFVTFHVADEIVAVKTVVKGNVVSRPTAAETAGYTINDWYYFDGETHESWKFFGYVITSDIDLYADFTYNHYTVNFVDDAFGQEVTPIDVTYDGSYTLPVLNQTGYTFANWTLDDEIIPSSGTYRYPHDITLHSTWTANNYVLTLDPNGGEVDQTSLDIAYDSQYALPIPTSEYYLFDGWYDGANLVSNTGVWKYTSNKTFTAHWTPISYQINYILNGGTNDSGNPASYTVEDTVYLLDPIRTGYSFLGWFDSNDNKINKIKVGSHGIISLTAKWNDGDSYIVTLDANGGSVSTDSVDVQYSHAYSLPIPTKAYHSFDGWYGGMTLVDNSGIWLYPNDRHLTAHWTLIGYNITYVLNGGVNNPSNPAMYTYEEEINLFNPGKQGYTFLGWYDENNNQVTRIEQGSSGDITLEARWQANLNVLTILSEDTSKGTVAITAGMGYSDEQITISATPLSGYIFTGWYSGDERVSSDSTYSFTMPRTSYSLTAHFMSQSEYNYKKSVGVIPDFDLDNNQVTYGLYPQSVIQDSDLIYELKYYGLLQENGCYLYNGQYYKKVQATPYGTNFTFDDGSIIYSQTYWFKCEPIVWDILDNDSGNYFLLSDKLLDAGVYYSSMDTRLINGQTVYPNNYKHSDVRNFLLGDFYNLAFSLDDSFIKTTHIDNSAASTTILDNPYACEDTDDKVFLLSASDYQNADYGFVDDILSNDLNRCALTTDFARSRGSNDFSTKPHYCHYWSRSPSLNTSGIGVYCMDSPNGAFAYNTYMGRSWRGMRPAITLSYK